MRILMMAILTAAAVAASAPAQAQTYDPNYPVCMQVFRPFSLFRLPLQLDPAMQASRRPAARRSASINPYFAIALKSRRSRRASPPPIRPDMPSYSSSMTRPASSDTRRSIRPASSMLWVAISIATRVALTSCISALNT